jgi:peptidoglycan/LPS O-acetylase OafA/YrhL
MQRRLVGLDGMRGMAALIVVLHHVCPFMHIMLFSRGYLAVDFFFMLSGYVLSRTYDERLRSGLTPAKFIRIRLRRLYPIMALGILAGAALAAQNMAPSILVVRLVAQLLFIPILVGGLPLFPLDGVQWSLALELIANLLHAMFLKSLRWRGLATVAALSLVLLGWAAFHYGSLGLGDTASNLIGGPPRLLFSYVVGCLLYRLVRKGVFGRLRFHPSLLALLPTALILAGFASAIWAGWLVDLITVAVIMPPIILIGAHVETSGIWSRIARQGGLLSYPLYALHIPLIGAALLLGGPSFVRYPVSFVVAVLGAWIAGNRLGPLPKERQQTDPGGLGTSLAQVSETPTPAAEAGVA